MRAETAALRVATYNIHRAVGTDRQRNPARIAGVLGDLVGMHENVEFGAARLDVASGERFFLYSDGLIERRAGVPGSVSDHLDHLCAAAQETAGLPMQDALDTMLVRLLGREMPRDDVVLLGVEV